MNRFIADDLIVPWAYPVLEAVVIHEGMLQGDSFGEKLGTLVQFYSGTSRYFVCVLTFEEWTHERCPRFTWYVQSDDDHRIYLQCADPSSKYTTDDIRNLD